MRIRRVLLFVFLFLLVAAACLGYFAYQSIYGKNVSSDQLFYVRVGDKTEDVLFNLDSVQIFDDNAMVSHVAKLMSFEESSVKPGRYLIKKGSSTFEVLDMLRLGEQVPMNITIRGIRTIDQLASLLGEQLMYDSAHYHRATSEDGDSALCHYLPNTYEFFWTADGKAFNQRMKKYSEEYWKDKSMNIEGLKLSRCEIYVLASIVEKETSYNPEKADVAGVYINRLKRGMPLQADPTVIFSIGDFTIRRVLTRYLSFDSPFNTYLYPGLPPGPICMPSMSSIEAVLNASDHDYLYFCAKADNSGTHAFAETLAQHNRNARAFQNWLNQQGINR